MGYYSKRYKDGTTTFPTRAFIENGWVVIHQSEVSHNAMGGTQVSSDSISIPIAEFKKIIKELNIDVS